MAGALEPWTKHIGRRGPIWVDIRSTGKPASFGVAGEGVLKKEVSFLATVCMSTAQEGIILVPVSPAIMSIAVGAAAC